MVESALPTPRTRLHGLPAAHLLDRAHERDVDSGLTSTESQPPGITTWIGLFAIPRRTAAQAAAHAEDPTPAWRRAASQIHTGAGGAYAAPRVNVDEAREDPVRLESGTQLGELAARDVAVLRTKNHTVRIADRHAREAQQWDPTRIGSSTTRGRRGCTGVPRAELPRPIATVALDPTPRASTRARCPPFRLRIDGERRAAGAFRGVQEAREDPQPNPILGPLPSGSPMPRPNRRIARAHEEAVRADSGGRSHSRRTRAGLIGSRDRRIEAR